ncbi:MAG: hypothetical protein KY392_05660, partial [Chloroflexi bacterium]|nr:hypothetical protein [Chloroflexota bacterium]
TALLKTKRRDIARIMTILNGRKTGVEKQAQKAAEAPTAPAADQETTTKKSKTSRFGAESAGVVEDGLDERSREILAEIERDREQRVNLEEQMGEESPFARPSEREATEVRPSERQPLPVQSLDRPRSGEVDLDIPSFLRRKND